LTRRTALRSYRFRLLQSLCLHCPARYTRHTAECGLLFLSRLGASSRAIERLSWGFCSLQRMRSQESVYPGFTSPGTFRSRGLVTSSAVYSSRHLPGFFHPGTLMGFALQSFPFRKSRTPLGALPLMLLLLHRHPWPTMPARSVSGTNRTVGTQLQGIALSQSPFTGRSLFKRRPGRCSPGLLLFREFPLPVVRDLFRRAPLMRFPKALSLATLRRSEPRPPCGFSASSLRLIAPLPEHILLAEPAPQSSARAALSLRSARLSERSTRSLEPPIFLFRVRLGSLGTCAVALRLRLLLTDSASP